MDPAIAPASRVAAITPSATTLVNARALYVGTAGDVAISPRRESDPVVFKNVPAGSILPVHCAILGTATTASDIVALF